MQMSTPSENKEDVERSELKSMKALKDNCIISNHQDDKEQGKFADNDAHKNTTHTGTPMTAATTQQMVNCNDMTGNAMEFSPTTPRGIFKVPRTNQEGRLDVVNEHLDNLEAATIGGDAPPIATLVDDVEVLEYAEAVPIEDATDAQAEIGGDAPPQATEVNDVEVLEYAKAVPIEDTTDAQAEIGGDAPPQATEVNDVEVLEYAEAVPIEDTSHMQDELERIIRRNKFLKLVTAFLLIIIALSIGMVFFLDDEVKDEGKEEEKEGTEEQNDEECNSPFPILCDVSLGEAAPDERKYCLDTYCECNDEDDGKRSHSSEYCHPQLGAIPCGTAINEELRSEYGSVSECAYQNYPPLNQAEKTLCAQNLELNYLSCGEVVARNF
mmetsp:Transcript_16161/g.23792  ORF Transcript_16161/g.23792 Transcript_16161/m.23792 type:complete len:382 (-) Transcript_16161:1113-2258(-)